VWSRKFCDHSHAAAGARCAQITSGHQIRRKSGAALSHRLKYIILAAPTLLGEHAHILLYGIVRLVTHLAEFIVMERRTAISNRQCSRKFSAGHFHLLILVEKRNN
jgi:hypothetical protein